MRLFLILAIVPVIEIALFIEVGGWIGTWPTVGIVFLTAIIGSILLRRQGIAALRDMQGRLAAGEPPERLLADGAMILVAGLLLLTPGFFTDALGFALLVPPVRTALWHYLSRNVTVHMATAHGGHWRAGGHDAGVVDGEYSEAHPPGSRPVDGPRLGGPEDGAR